jgi:hypothetical protein
MSNVFLALLNELHVEVVYRMLKERELHLDHVEDFAVLEPGEIELQSLQTFEVPVVLFQHGADAFEFSQAVRNSTQ